MTILNDHEAAQDAGISSPRARMRMLQQMAEALEDEAAGLYRRAAAYEEEEFLLNREVTERQTEINRLMLKLEAMRSQRDALMEKINAVRDEAAAIREEAFNSEEEMALAAIDDARVKETRGSAQCESEMGFAGEVNASHSSAYFRRMIPAYAR